QVQSRIKMLEKIDLQGLDLIDKKSIHFKFPPAPSSGKIAVEIKNFSKSYGSKNVLKDIDITILRNEFIAFVGRNGEGKSTLAKSILKQIDFEGEINLGHNVKVGYYAQNQADLLDDDDTVFEVIDNVAVGEIRKKVKGILGSFLFSGEDIEKKVKVLSGGERSRLALAKLLLEPVNLLILDEPTNHLDMQSKDILKQALLKFDGTLILVSHDRDFLKGLSNKVYEFRNHKIKEHLGDITEFIEKRRIADLRQLEIKKKETKEKPTNTTNKEEYARRKEFDKKVRKVNRLISQSEANMEALENKIAEMDAKLASPDQAQGLISDVEFYKEYNKLKQDLSNEEEVWEANNLQLEELEKR
ncbi:MAG: ABC-F family ATP-binding cassette domain-containing protein, partial [Bacteroidales bacterium]|nr:ABC-F family ATP-binding cassette domain-containing protein [Bacteroidales bacterium]